MVGDAGPALWEEEVEGDDNFSVPMAATCGAGCSEVFVFQGYRYRQETHTRLFALNANGPAIISSYQVPQARGPYTFVSFLEDLPHLFALESGDTYGDTDIPFALTTRFLLEAVASCGDVWGSNGQGDPRDQSHINSIGAMETKGGVLRSVTLQIHYHLLFFAANGFAHERETWWLLVL